MATCYLLQGIFQKRDKNKKSYSVSVGSTYYVLSNVKVLSRKLICVVVDGCNVLITYSVNELLNTTKHKLNISALVLKGQIFQEN